jgi:hypothetical protein
MPANDASQDQTSREVIVAPQAAMTLQSGISNELKEVLEFTASENQKHREYFQMLYRWTAGALTIIVVLISALVAFVGWHTIDDIKKTGSIGNAGRNRQHPQTKPRHT